MVYLPFPAAIKKKETNKERNILREHHTMIFPVSGKDRPIDKLSVVFVRAESRVSAVSRDKENFARQNEVKKIAKTPYQKRQTDKNFTII